VGFPLRFMFYIKDGWKIVADGTLHGLGNVTTCGFTSVLFLLYEMQ